jgi:hypothetical protein
MSDISQETRVPLKTIVTTATILRPEYKIGWTNKDIAVISILVAVFLSGAACVAYELKNKGA